MDFTLQLQQSLQSLIEQPQRFNEITKQAILQLAKIHNSHNRLLPADLVADIIEQLYSINPFQNRKSSVKFAFLYNIVRHVILSNFYQIKDNKVFAVIAMIYAQKLSEFYHQVENQQKSLAVIRHVAQMAIINEITLKYAQKTKIFFPEYIKALKISVQKLQHSINRNIRHSSKVQSEATQFGTTESVLNIAFSKDTQKRQLILILIGLLNYVLKQAGSFFSNNPNKKDLLKLQQVQQIIQKIQQLQQKLPQQLGSQLIVPPQFKKYEQKQGQQNAQRDGEPIYLEEPIQVRELTPRFYDEEQGTKMKLLRKKKNKLEKKMQLQLRQSTHQRLQQKRIVQGVKKDKIQRQVKKDIFVLQKQTEQAKKAFKQMKKVKNIKKEAKLGRKGKK